MHSLNEVLGSMDEGNVRRNDLCVEMSVRM